jgi:integrase/recombinase XerD
LNDYLAENRDTEASRSLRSAQLQIMDLEQAKTAPALSNLDLDRLLIDASNDREAIALYLLIRCQKPTTRNAVQRDLRKFAVFMHLESLRSLREVKAEHCQAFQAWLMAPAPELCAGKNCRPPGLTFRKAGREVPNPDWKPFRAPLSPVSTNQTVDKIKALYAWLVNAGYLSGNPWSLIKPVTKATTTTKDETEDGDARELPLRCIQAVLHYLDHGAGFGKVKFRRFAQWRWLFHFYLYTAARLSSGCTATLDDIYRNRKGHNQLTLTVKGTGIRRKDVPWIPELEAEYLRYRTALGLPQIIIKKGSSRRQPNDPLSSDQGPRHLLLPLTASAKTKESKPLTYHSVHGHIVDLFRTAREWAIESTELHLEDWELVILDDATGHWIRHGTATLLGIHAKSQLGHSSMKQTDAYQAKVAEQHRHRLRHLINPEEPPYQALLDENLSVRVEWLKKLMESIEYEDSNALDEVLATFVSGEG